MKIGVTGASGFLGKAVLAEAKKRKWEVVAFSRNEDVPIIHCDEVRSLLNPAEADLSGLDALIHLAGEPVVGRWTEEKKQRILDSRVDLTTELVKNLENMPENQRPRTFVSASGAGIYGDCGDDLLDEESDIGFGFLAKVCGKWEAAAVGATDLGIRTVRARIGIVIGRDGGIVKAMRTPFRLGLGGRLGAGDQWMSWIHLQDAAKILLFCVEHSAVKGAVNCVAPHPVTNAEFTRVFADSLDRKARFPIPHFLLKRLPNGMSEMFLFSQRIDPVVARAFDFKWEYERLDDALSEVFSEPDQNREKDE